MFWFRPKKSDRNLMLTLQHAINDFLDVYWGKLSIEDRNSFVNLNIKLYRIMKEEENAENASEDSRRS
jgi:hypothetical protein